jgi:glutaminase
MQHPERYCRSAKSYAAHLTRLCCGLEHNGDHEVYEAIQKSLNGAVAFEKPEAPINRGQMTVTDLLAASKVEEHTRLVKEWAESVWEAYASQHDIARKWIKAAQSNKEIARH